MKTSTKPRTREKEGDRMRKIFSVVVLMFISLALISSIPVYAKPPWRRTWSAVFEGDITGTGTFISSQSATRFDCKSTSLTFVEGTVDWGSYDGTHAECSVLIGESGVKPGYVCVYIHWDHQTLRGGSCTFMRLFGYGTIEPKPWVNPTANAFIVISFEKYAIYKVTTRPYQETNVEVWSGNPQFKITLTETI